MNQVHLIMDHPESRVSGVEQEVGNVCQRPEQSVRILCAIEEGWYHMAGVARFTICHSSGDLAALYSNTTG